MADLENSKRSLERATYTPISPARQIEHPIGRAVDKWSYFAGLKPTVNETSAVVRLMTSGDHPIPDTDRQYLPVLATAASEMTDTSDASLPMRMLRAFGPVPASVLKRFGEELLQIRKATAASTLSSQAALLTRYEQAIRNTSASPAEAKPTLSSDYKLDPKFVLAGVPGAKAYRYETTPAAIPSGQGAPADATGMTATASAILVHPSTESPAASTVDRTPLSVATLLDWAVGQRLETKAIEHTQAILASANTSADLSLADFKTLANLKIAQTKELNYAFDQRVHMEPIGILHLERLSFIPAGIERGELLYSVPLSPAERVNISHKEWSNTSQEFEQIVTDSLEAYSEQGVTEKSELVQSTNSQREHASGYELGVTATGSWGPVTISASANYHVADSANSSQTTARTQSNELTRKASSRVKKEHKTSFKVASASGTEDQAVRLITNPFPDKAVRVDYYQLVRKWRVDLYRYGLRMTYDLAIPEPGSDILSKIVEIQSLNSALSEGFAGANSTLPWARFDLTPQQISRGNYLGLAAQYGTPVEPPPVDQLVIARTFTKNWANKDAANDSDYTTFDIDVPEGYLVSGWSNQWTYWAWTDESYHFELHPDLNAWLGVAGHLTMSVGTKYVSAFSIDLKLWLNLSPDAYDAWRQRVWGTLREAAQARYELNRTMLSGRLARLQDELGAQDPLSLRKIEREEVMKHVLRWLLGPSFTFVPPGLPPDLYNSSGSIVNDQVWAQVLAQGDIIKFLHQAVEWENMLFFLYPYFWSHTSRWEFKKYLDHPDFLHRSFLKAGSARVVLTIRPDFEHDFVSFVETGTLDNLPQTHPYMTIATEMRAFADTNYPGLPSANPIEDARPLLSPAQRKAWDEMQAVIALLNQYKTTHGDYPSTAQGLAALASIGTVPAADPWGHPYQYRSPGRFTDFELASLGADGAIGGDNDNADIESWVEASLIGRWYEYTPTSAIDISFNETLPTF